MNGLTIVKLGLFLAVVAELLGIIGGVGSQQVQGGVERGGSIGTKIGLSFLCDSFYTFYIIQ